MPRQYLATYYEFTLPGSTGVLLSSLGEAPFQFLTMIEGVDSIEMKLCTAHPVYCKEAGAACSCPDECIMAGEEDSLKAECYTNPNCVDPGAQWDFASDGTMRTASARNEDICALLTLGRFTGDTPRALPEKRLLTIAWPWDR